MSEELKPNKAAFEKMYSDNSGVEFAVRFCGDSIEFEAVDSVFFPMDKIDFLIGALEQIKEWNTRTGKIKGKSVNEEKSASFINL